MPDLRAALTSIRRFVRDRSWEPFHDPKNLAMAVASEAGELVAELRWIDSAEADEVAGGEPTRARLTDEAADVAITLLMFCDRVGIDLPSAIEAKLDKNALRYPVFLPFEEPDLELMPWSARRALDHVGRKVSLAEWKSMPLDERRRLAGLGSVPRLDVGAVGELGELGGGAPIERFTPPDAPPEALETTTEAWAALSVVARHALHAYARREKLERMREAYDALTSSGESQSTR